MNTSKLKIVVVGVGNAGTHMVEKLLESQIADKVKLIAVDVDKQALENSSIQQTFQFPDGSIFEEITVEEAEKKHLVTDKRLGDVPIPFGFINSQWEELKGMMQSGDKLYYFSSSEKSWNHLAGRKGYALYRDDKEIFTMVTGMS